MAVAPEVEQDDGLCKHSLHPLPKADCTLCSRSPEQVIKEAHDALPKPKEERPQKPKRQVDPIARHLAEYLSGYRCDHCDTLRDEKGLCDHEREQLLARKAAECGRFERARGDLDDRKKRFIHGAAALGRRRSVLQAGMRDTPAPNGLTVGQSVSISARVRSGTAMEWKQGQPSGDELPL